MVDMSRLGRGKITLAKEPVEMSAVVAKAVERVSASIEQRRHALRVDVPESGLIVDGDPARLAQIVRHLLDNAAKYTAPGGRIGVTAWREEDHVKLSVTDNGTGIDPDVLPRLFDRFRDARTNVERAPGGLGIGLSIVSRLAELHAGSVSASSEGLDRGSEFVVTLPAHAGAEPAKHSETAPRTDAAAQPERVLVVDDNRDAAELVAAVLSSAGHDVSVAHDALQALSLIARLKPGVVVLDIGLPVMDGYELASRIREAFGENSPRLVAVTGYSLDEDRARSRDIGIDIHLVKPVDVQKLIEAVGARSAALEHPEPITPP
jgi:CheY-like chemotaxis protein